MAETAQQDPGRSAVDHPPLSTRRQHVVSYAIRLTVGGRVQGVGFRPFVYRLAREHGLTGHVQNQLGEVEIVVCGRPAALKLFRHELIELAPPLAEPTITKLASVDTVPFESFEIISSSGDADASVFVPPDYFMCEDCQRELKDPTDRRFRYPFINCTQCGPRYTLIESLPYDRPNTSMASFPLCARCETEYRDPSNRRFHAEPVSCPDCGPTLVFERPGDGEDLASAEQPIEAALDSLRRGEIVAVKGIGGYHLMCDARNVDAVATLRDRKRRPHKPLAVMFPQVGASGLRMVHRYVTLNKAEAELLQSAERPIVLTKKKADSDLAANVAPDLDELGLFLPYSPVHQLLTDGFGAPLVATSGNISGEPVLTDSAHAMERLSRIADAFLNHDRPILRPADDPVYRRIAGRMRPLRLGRGTAPRELELPWRLAEPVMAVGGHMKGTVTIAWEQRAVVSPHIGEMDCPRSLAMLERVAGDLQSLYGIEARRIVCDAHPGYTTHRWAHAQSLPVETVWHHRAHASAVAAEYALPGRWLVFTWDGVGLGEDGTLWGGEAMYGEAGDWRRVASLRPFRLPGGERAGREPWRSAAAIHWECGREWPDCPHEDGLAQAAWQRGINCPETSAAGRLFDAAAALVTGRSEASYEAQGPMALESLCRQRGVPVYTSLHRNSDDLWRCDWEPLIRMLADTRVPPQFRAETFHASLALAILQQARRVRDEFPVDQVGLTGGVFQNRTLTDEAVETLERNGFRVLIPEALPANDAALSFGQAAEFAARERLD